MPKKKPSTASGRIYMSSFEMSITRGGVTEVFHHECVRRELINGHWVDVGPDGKPLVSALPAKQVTCHEVKRIGKQR
jgi:hypothetical protein